MPRILGNYRLSFGERATFWWPDVDGNTYHVVLGDPFVGTNFEFRNAGGLNMITPGDSFGVNANFVVNDSIGNVSILSEGVPGPLITEVTAIFGRVVVNDGSITARSPQDATGVFASSLLVNRGSIRVEAVEFGYGVRTDRATFVNSGSITVSTGLRAIGAEVIDGVTHRNFGHITAQATDPNGVSMAVYTHGYYQNRIDFQNAGILEGDYAYYAYGGGGLGTVLGISDILVNGTTGQMRGAVYTAFGHDAVLNQGLITGPVILAHGADVFDGGQGAQLDVVDGGDGADTLLGGAGSDYLFGGEGSDVLRGGGGGDIVDGGRGSDYLDGGDGFDTLYFLEAWGGVTVNLAAGTASGQGSDVVRNFERVLGSIYGDVVTGSGGDDVLEGLAGADVLDGSKGDDLIIGGTGDDALSGGLGADVFAFTAGDGRDVIEDFDAGDLLSIHGYGAAQAILQEGANVRVVLSAGDSILLRNLQVADLTPSRLQFSATPLQADLTSGPGRTLLSGEDVVITAGERLILTDASPVSLGGWAHGAAAILLYEAQGIQERRASIWIAGEVRLDATSNGLSVVGVRNAMSGAGSGADTFHNQLSGVISVVNHGTAQTTGVAYSATNSFNDGLIEVTGGGDVLGVEAYNFSNTGRLVVDAGGAGVGIRGFTTLWNSGSIEVNSHLAGVGMLFSNTNFFTNTGLIRVTDDTAELDSTGVSYALANASSSFVNTGIIEADYAIRYGSVSDNHNPNNTVVQTIRNSGELRGVVSLTANRDALFNHGLITGEVRMGQGDDMFDGRAGVQAGGVSGGDGDDGLYGGASADRLDGGAGADIINGGGGDDTLTGGAGADRFIIGQGHDVITDFNVAEDRISGPFWQSLEQVGADTLMRISPTSTVLFKNVVASSLTVGHRVDGSGVPGQNWIPGTPLNPLAPVAPPAPQPRIDPLVGGEAGDALTGGAGADRLLGLGGDDTLSGGGGDDMLAGDAGTDRLTGGGGADMLYGGAGADIFIFNDNSLDGEGDDRIVDFNPAEGDLIYLTGSQAWFVLDGQLQFGQRAVSFANVEGWQAAIRYGAPPSGPIAPGGTGLTFTGTSGRDVKFGGDWADTLDGLGGLDVLDGAGGDDILNGGDGDDLLSGGVGGDSLNGGAGDDTLRGGAGADLLSGGDGADTADYGDATSGVRVDLGLTTAQDTLGGGADTLIGVERLAGSAWADVLRGTSGDNVLFGGAGDDRLEGLGGGDFLDGGAGEDTAVFTGPRSSYTLSWTDDAADGVTVTGPDGAARVVNVEWLQFADERVGAARTIHTFAGAASGETATGTNFHDLLDGGEGDDVLNGLNGDDVIHGGDGADRLTGGAGDQQLFGDAGDDILTSSLAATTGTHASPSRAFTRVLLDGGEGNDQIDFLASGLPVDRVTALGGDGDDVIQVRGAFKATIDGGAGDDVIVVGKAWQGVWATGGLGRDTFIVTGPDPNFPSAPWGAAMDFTAGPGGDRIDVWSYISPRFPGVSVGQNLFELGLVRLTERANYGVTIDVLTGPGGFFTSVMDLPGVNAYQLTIENFVGMSSGHLGGFPVMGSSADEVMRGNDQANVMTGEAGADVLYGEGGDDNLSGGAGPDTLYGGDGNDYLHVGLSRDVNGIVIGRGDYAYGGAGDDVFAGGQRDAHLFGGTGNDTYTGDNFVHEYAGEGVDSVFNDQSRTLSDNVENLFLSWTNSALQLGQFDTTEARTGTGNAVDNRIVGASGTDTLSGLDGGDVLEGLAGADVLYGGAGDDVLTGGLGNDILNGGQGFDVVHFTGARSDYRLVYTHDGRLIVKGGSDGGDQLINVEEIRFGDGRKIELLLQAGPPAPKVLPGLGDAFLVPGPEILPGEAGGKWMEQEPLVQPGEAVLPVLLGPSRFRPDLPHLFEQPQPYAPEPDWLF